jgi:hypothetical protein
MRRQCCRIPNPTLTTHDGRAVRFYDDLVRGKVVVLAFAYTRFEGSCPITTAKLAGVQRRLGERVGDDVSLVTITLDPDHDTQARGRRTRRGAREAHRRGRGGGAHPRPHGPHGRGGWSVSQVAVTPGDPILATDGLLARPPPGWAQRLSSTRRMAMIA